MVDAEYMDLAELTRTLVERFAPERIILFGSPRRGDHHQGSDYDLMMVLGESPHSEDVVRRAVQEIRANVEIVVDTGERLECRRSDVGTLEFVADHEGRILYTSMPVPDARRVRKTPSDPPDSLEEWIARARSDFAMMEMGLGHGLDVRDGVVLHTHQAVERML